MGPRRNPPRDTAANKAASLNELRAASLSGNSDSEEEQSFELFVRRKLIQIALGQSKIEERLGEAIDFNSGRIKELEETSNNHKKELTDLKEEVTALKQKLDRQTQDINKNERFSRCNNFRIVGVAKEDEENCMEIVKQLLCDKFDWNEENPPKIERAHRDGRQNARPHILVKMLSYQDKVAIMKSAREKMKDSTSYILDDLTYDDLKEKKKWKDEVKALYDNGVKLKFVAGKWRTREGAIYKFQATE